MSQTNPVALGRKEADRFNKGGRLRVLLRRPEVGAFFVMVAVVAAIAIASNGVALNPLGLKNNLSIISQFGIIATGACLLMIAGEFDLSIGSMIGFAGMAMAMMLKWGLPFGLGPATPVTAFFVTLAMTLALGWLIGFIVVRSRLSSFIVTLGLPVLPEGPDGGLLPADQSIHPDIRACRTTSRTAGSPRCSAARASAGCTISGLRSAET